MYPTMEDREQVEIVFGLTGGELEVKPLRYLAERVWQSDGTGTGEYRRRWAPHWYTGSPDYAPEIARRWNKDVITVVTCELFGPAPRKIRARGKVWRKIATYRSSGEAECIAPHDPQDGECPLCESDHSETSYVYLGDGMAEVVYIAR